jgi:hypothetical protein
MSSTHPAAVLSLKIVAVFGEEIVAGTAVARAGRHSATELRAQSFEVISARSAADAMSVVAADPLMGCLMVDVDLDTDDGAARVRRAPCGRYAGSAFRHAILAAMP